ncbi:hypothetical protein PITC_068980 [Penicillium italicum]|uniref:Uncharacterized protein n=1 Tax=Penicillium italicum TaxID=40296 RepID=A0A0A2LQA4_PENIT|nr:hypothetical protein PITC_068980 [Penicillium italicum]
MNNINSGNSVMMFIQQCRRCKMYRDRRGRCANPWELGPS